MLPDNLSGSYKAYKSDTNAFVTWLSRTALACGYILSEPTDNGNTGDPPQDAPKPSGTRLKGKARVRNFMVFVHFSNPQPSFMKEMEALRKQRVRFKNTASL